MSGKYTILAKNYDYMFWMCSDCTNSLLEALIWLIKAYRKYDYVQLEIRK